MEELLKKFPNGIELYKENAVFNKLCNHIYQGMPIETAFVEAIKVIEEQQKTMRKLIENQPQSIILTRE